MHPLLEIKNLSVDFVQNKEVTQAVKNISFTVHRGEILALVGESGSGKSVTALSILQLLSAPPAQYSSGSILFYKGQIPMPVLQLSPTDLQHIRGRHIAMIFQEPMTSLNPVMRCGMQVMEALLAHISLSKTEAKKRTIDWFKKVKLPDAENLFYRYPHQLSGGQKQRVMIAMAMISEPSLLICDEPTTALDVTVQKSIIELIKELQQQQGMGVLFITHDLGVVAQIADRTAIMYKGEIIEQGMVQTIFKNPQQLYTKALLACRPSLHSGKEPLPTVNEFLTKQPSPLQLKIKKEYSTPVIPKNEKALIEVKNLTVSFVTKTNIWGKPLRNYAAVDKVSFSIKKGQTLGLVGESGCGKTTLGRTLLRLIEPAEGNIIFNGEDITHLDKKKLKGFRQQVQLVFQDPYSSLNPRLTIESALMEPMNVFGIGHNKKQRRKKVAALLEQVSLPANIVNRYPHQFSGGQRQRIVIARALALNPSFLVCDESVSALDVSVQAQVLNLLNDIKRDFDLTLLFISHDLSVVRYMSDTIMVMEKGKIIESGNAEILYTNPQQEYTKKLLASIPAV